MYMGIHQPPKSVRLCGPPSFLMAPARYDIPAKMTFIIRQFHSDMRACIRPERGETSEWLSVQPGPPPMLFPRVFGFFAAVLTVTFYILWINYAEGQDFICIAEKCGEPGDILGKA